jgi:hypothetical protein
MARLTSPCSFATPLARAARRRPITAMLKRSSPGVGLVAEGQRGRREVDAALGGEQTEKYFSMSSRGKRSMPAGTGVWVVKTVPARTASMASPRRARRPTMLADALEAEEAGVALVGVEDLGSTPERLERPDAADAEQDLLAQRCSVSPP